jgi:hypothetical protein
VGRVKWHTDFDGKISPRPVEVKGSPHSAVRRA